MNLQIVTLEITNLIIAFDHYDKLVSSLPDKNTAAPDEHQKIHKKSREHLNSSFGDTKFYNETDQLINLADIKGAVISRLSDMGNKEIHELVEKLEKDTKKMKKLYKARL